MGGRVRSVGGALTQGGSLVRSATLDDRSAGQRHGWRLLAASAEHRRLSPRQGREHQNSSRLWCQS